MKDTQKGCEIEYLLSVKHKTYISNAFCIQAYANPTIKLVVSCYFNVHHLCIKSISLKTVIQIFKFDITHFANVQNQHLDELYI